MRLNVYIILLASIMLIAISCEDPLSPRYLNSSDVYSSAYIPVVPSNLEAIVVNDSLFSLQWIDQSLAEDGFKLYLKSGNDSVFILLAILDSNTTSFNDTLPKNHDIVYEYRLYAYSGTRLSKTYSTTTAQFSFHTPAITSISGIDSTRLTIHWQSNISFPTVTIIEKMEATSFSVLAEISPGVNTFTDSSVSKYHTYRYRITSRTNYNVSTTSNIVRCGFQITGVSQTRLINTPLTPGSGYRGLLSDDGKMFLSVGAREAAIVDFLSGTTIRTITYPHEIGNVNQIALSKNKQVFAIAGWHDSAVYVYRISDGVLLRTFKGDWPGVDVVLTDDGLQAILSLGYGDIQCWKIADSTLVWSINARTVSYPDYPLNVGSLWLHPDGQKILIGIGTFCKLVDINTGAVLSSSQGGYFLRTPAVLNGEILVIATDGICHNVTRDRSEFIVSSGMKSASISSDKLFVLLSRDTQETRIINLVTGGSLYVAQNLWGWHHYARFLDDDRQVLIYNQEGQVSVLQLSYNWGSF